MLSALNISLYDLFSSSTYHNTVWLTLSFAISNHSFILSLPTPILCSPLLYSHFFYYVQSPTVVLCSNIFFRYLAVDHGLFCLSSPHYNLNCYQLLAKPIENMFRCLVVLLEWRKLELYQFKQRLKNVKHILNILTVTTTGAHRSVVHRIFSSVSVS